MPFEDRKKLIRNIESLRDGRRLVVLCNFDRAEVPGLGAMATQFDQDLKEPLFRVLKETIRRRQKLDLFLYTRGGATNAVWPVASLLREFDPNFQVLVPFRAHSSGTLLTLAAESVVMTPLAELSPIDPTTGNQFNPPDPANPQSRLGISVEDVSAYREFWRKAITAASDCEGNEELNDRDRDLLQPHLHRLATEIHPLALGNVHRVHMQTTVLAEMLLEKHYGKGAGIDAMIRKLTTGYYSHHHMISRHEARGILGKDHVTFASAPLSRALDELLRAYEDGFELRQPFYLNRFLGDDAERDARFIGGCVESCNWGYLHESEMKLRQYLAPPPNVQIQVQPGQIPPLVPGLPRKYEFQVVSRGWVRNTRPRGVSK